MKLIEVKNVSKEYHLGSVAKDSIVDSVKMLFNRKSKAKEESFWALKDISFDLNEGEVLGIIGKNGAGKSTLLKVLSRITEPTSGEIKIKGRVASLLEVGTGFHPELSGRENVFLNGSILGMQRKEIKAKFGQIVDFAGVGKFIDTPVKHYSSGMYVRLAFSVAAHLEPEILIIDEVLAVGDADFQKKCLGKMRDVAGQGRTVLFVSHNMAAVKKLCDKILVLNQGRVAKYGTVDESIGYYLNQGSSELDGIYKGENVLKDGVKINYLRLIDKNGNISSHFTNFEKIKIQLSIFIERDIRDLKIRLMLTYQTGTEVLTTFHNDTKELPFAQGDNTLEVEIPENLMNKGFYFLSVSIGVHKQKWILDEEGVIKFEVDFVTKNNNLLQANNRGSAIAPLLDWKLIN